MQWSVAVFAHNEERSLPKCLDHILAECVGHDARIHVIVNGATDGALAAAQRHATRDSTRLLVFRVAHSDKSNAWNQYVHTLRIEAAVHFFVDAYAYVKPGSFRALADAVTKSGVNAATAVPGSGRSREQITASMRENGGLHGSLHALSGEFLARVRERSVRLPLDLYRGDGLIGAMAAYDLEPQLRGYSRSRIAIVETAAWSFDPLRFWRWRDIRRVLRRRMRQIRGDYESEAFKRIVKTFGFEALPLLADDMISEFITNHGLLSSSVPGRLMHRLALRNTAPGNCPQDADLRAIAI